MLLSPVFDQKLLMRLADKSDLQNRLIKKVTACVAKEVPIGLTYIIDGGSLPHRLPWSKSTSYASINGFSHTTPPDSPQDTNNSTNYILQFIRKHYRNAIVVFDGYASGPSTMDETHQRRTCSEIGASVDFTSDMLLKMKKKNSWQTQERRRKTIIT